MSLLKTSLPSKITFRELAAREGYQSLKSIYPTQHKFDFVAVLMETGAPEIEVTSFVRSDKVPQMADADDLISKIAKHLEASGSSALETYPNQKLTALYLNKKGYERARMHSVLSCEPWVHTSVRASFLAANMDETAREHRERLTQWAEYYKDQGVSYLRVMVSTAFGTPQSEPVSSSQLQKSLWPIFDLCDQLELEVKELCLADTAGVGSPYQVRSFLEMLRKQRANLTISLHLHDTRGLGISNAYAGLQEGVQIFESSLGGLGGCPFLDGASGNIATEELINLCEGLGVETPSSVDRYREAIKKARELFDFDFPSKLSKVLLT